MGIYIYALQPPDTVTEAQLNGLRVRIGRVKFAYKPYSWDEVANSHMDKQIVGPLRRAWAGKPRPRFVFIGDPVGDNPTVYSWPQGWVSCADDINFGVKVKEVGRLYRGVIQLEE
jgi:hypothetical protein